MILLLARHAGMLLAGIHAEEADTCGLVSAFNVDSGYKRAGMTEFILK